MEFLPAFTSGVVLVGGPLLSVYLTERAKVLAHEAADRVLAENRERHERELAALNADLQRREGEFSLFAQRRHQAYGVLFARYREAVDHFASLAGFSIAPDFSTFTLADAQAYMKANELPEGDAAPVLEGFFGGRTDGPKLLQSLDYRVRKRDAERAFNRAKITEGRWDLYLSDAAREVLVPLRKALAALSTEIQFAEPGRLRVMIDQRKETEKAIETLRGVMRAELQSGISAVPNGLVNPSAVDSTVPAVHAKVG